MIIEIERKIKDKGILKNLSSDKEKIFILLKDVANRIIEHIDSVIYIIKWLKFIFGKEIKKEENVEKQLNRRIIYEIKKEYEDKVYEDKAYFFINFIEENRKIKLENFSSRLIDTIFNPELIEKKIIELQKKEENEVNKEILKKITYESVKRNVILILEEKGINQNQILKFPLHLIIRKNYKKLDNVRFKEECLKQILKFTFKDSKSFNSNLSRINEFLRDENISQKVKYYKKFLEKNKFSEKEFIKIEAENHQKDLEETILELIELQLPNYKYLKDWKPSDKAFDIREKNPDFLENKENIDKMLDLCEKTEEEISSVVWKIKEQEDLERAKIENYSLYSNISITAFTIIFFCMFFYILYLKFTKKKIKSSECHLTKIA